MIRTAVAHLKYLPPKGTPRYQRGDRREWPVHEQAYGKTVQLRGVPRAHKVTLFRVVVAPRHTDYSVTNDRAQDSTQAGQAVCGWRWQIAQFHRETKPVTGIAGCPCRNARIVRNHSGCALLVWVRLKQVAQETGQTIYQVKHGLLSAYVRQHLMSPSIKMERA